MLYIYVCVREKLEKGQKISWPGQPCKLKLKSSDLRSNAYTSLPGSQDKFHRITTSLVLYRNNYADITNVAKLKYILFTGSSYLMCLLDILVC